MLLRLRHPPVVRRDHQQRGSMAPTPATILHEVSCPGTSTMPTWNGDGTRRRQVE
jgi:hypothetical protein